MFISQPLIETTLIDYSMYVCVSWYVAVLVAWWLVAMNFYADAKT